ncbi:cation-translocating P-type ATPase [Caenimonas terrae]|uniref:Cation-translocating P-type ATPase n=1 Tax=Caenimonas terrae TaxID=696074 RepID=A0ABW0NFR5_9BURK
MTAGADTSAAPAGLSAAQAALRLAQDGPNSLPGSEPRPLWRIALGVLLEPMFLMLLVAGGLYLALGSAAEATFLLVSVFAVIALALAQERKTQRALEALRDLSAPRALVLRDGQELRIASREVVRGDLLVLHEGDRIAADAVLLEGELSADESLLTGEAATQDKLPGQPAQEAARPGADAHSALFASTVVTAGRGLALVQATGERTAVGRIGLALAATVQPASQLQRSSRRVVRVMAGGGLALAALLVLTAWLWDGRPALDSLLLGIALAMAILPEEIPVVLTVFLALGAWRLSRQHVLTRRVQAVEALGAITVLAVDKTGTLTLNRMQVAELRAGPHAFREQDGGELPEPLHELAELAALATPADPFDPMEKAIHAFAQRRLPGTGRLHADWTAQQLYPLSRELLAMTHVFAPPGAARVVATKGAPEAIAALCRLEGAQLEAVRAQVQEMAQHGLRVLGVARGEWDGPELPAGQHEFHLRFLGLVALADPPRPEVPAAIAACRRAGIRVLMMTGDHPATARAIAQRVGLGEGAGLLTGQEIDALDDAALAQRLVGVAICARLAPEHKLRLVRALQAAGETVGMTGDGVNDAPALKAADVGVAMGQRGTDVAREAADLVLLDDSFASIVVAVRQGRHIDDNIAAALRFIFAVHVPVIALALLPVLLHWPALLLPAQIVLLELVIDPACALLFEAEPPAPDLMERPPRAGDQSPFAGANLAWGLLEGVGLAAVLAAGCAWLVAQHWADAQVRSTAFVALVGGLFLLMLARRPGASQARNTWFAPLLAAVVAVLVLVLGVPLLRELLGFAPPSWPSAAAAGAMLAAIGLWLLALRRLDFSGPPARAPARPG